MNNLTAMVALLSTLCLTMAATVIADGFGVNGPHWLGSQFRLAGQIIYVEARKAAND